MAGEAIGILEIGFALPRARLSLREIGEATGAGRAPAGDRAVANHDEDAVTLMVEAALAAAGDGIGGIDLVVAATTTPPCVEKSSAALVVEACDGADAVATLDVGGSRRAGIEALWAAVTAVRAGACTRALVCVADTRPVAPRDPLETLVADGGCAFVVGRGDGLATVEGAAHAHAEVWDVWRREGEPLRAEDARGVREAALERPLAQALERLGVRGTRVARFAAAADARAARSAAKRAGVAADAVIADDAGDAGCAWAPLLAARAIAGARDGEAIVVCAHGDGARALALRAGPRAASFAWPETRTRRVSYPQALFMRGLAGARPPSPAVAAALLAAERDALVRLRGARCAKCGAVTFPPERLCVSCGADGLRVERLARRGTVFTFTRDHLFQGADAVTPMAVVDLDRGGRVYVQATDCQPDEIDIGAPVELVFRRIHEGGGHPVYSWKCRPR